VGRTSIWNRIGSSIVGRILGTGDHDILFPISSSIPTLRAARSQPLRGRSHFEYFTNAPGEEVAPHFVQAVDHMQLGVA
jgi:hypothetical protein